MQSAKCIGSALRFNRFQIRNYRYKIYSYPEASFPAPHGKWKNMDPGMRLPKKEGGQDAKLVAGSEAPLAWTGKKEFPDWYRPYLLNYQGNGYMFMALLALTLLGIYQYEHTRRLQGRKSMVSHREDHKIENCMLFHRMIEKERRENDKIAVYRYVKRYMKESGF